jgi:hypothetical protein
LDLSVADGLRNGKTFKVTVGVDAPQGVIDSRLGVGPGGNQHFSGLVRDRRLKVRHILAAIAPVLHAGRRHFPVDKTASLRLETKDEEVAIAEWFKASRCKPSGKETVGIRAREGKIWIKRTIA